MTAFFSDVSVTKLIHHGKIYYQATWYAAGQRKRKWFRTKSGATTFAGKMSKAQRAGLAEFDSLSDDVKLDLLADYKRAARNGYTIREACQAFEDGGDSRPGIVFDNAVAAFLKAKAARNLRARTLKTYRYVFEPFSRLFGSTDLHEITRGDVLDWLTALDVGPRTYNNYLIVFSTLRNWAGKEGYNIGKVDPFGLEQKILDESDPCILELDDVRRDPAKGEPLPLRDYVLAACEIEKVGLVVVLVLFCGLRIEEASRTELADIKLGRSVPVVMVKGQASKKRNRRVVELLPNAVEWVRYALGRGCIVPVTTDEFNLNRKRKMIPTGPNAMRHSFCSYHLAAFKNKNETAYLAGNSPDIIDTNYKNLVAPEDAARFWALLPEG